MKLRQAVLWAVLRRKQASGWTVRAVAFYAGYRVLHHEVYETQTSEPLLIFLGLWLCGIAPATFFDSVRKAGIALQSELEKQTDEATKGIPPAPEPPTPTPEPQSANGSEPQ